MACQGVCTCVRRGVSGAARVDARADGSWRKHSDSFVRFNATQLGFQVSVRAFV